jgi:pimeloyl-ACP methyl ester carboxylesterase
VTTVVSMAGGLNSKGWSAEMKEERRKLTYDDLAKNAAEFVAERKKLMPEPDRFPELVERLKARWLADTFVEDEKAKAIKAPVLVVAGDHDETAGLERSVSVYRTIPGSRLSVFPNCDHVGLIFRPDLFQAIVIPFLLDPKS